MNVYEKNYIRWYIRAHKKIYLSCAVFLFVCLPMFSLLVSSQMDERIARVPFNNCVGVYTVLMLLFAFLVPIYNFNFLMGKRSVDTFFAMPIKRKRFFVLQFFLGIISILIFVNGAFLLAMLCDPSTWGLFAEFITLMLTVSLLTFALYTLYSYLVVKCNNLWDACCICIGYTILPIFMFLALNVLIENALSSLLVSHIASANEVLPEIWVNFCSMIIAITTLSSDFSNVIYMELYNNGDFFTLFMTLQRIIVLCFCGGISVLLYVRAKSTFATRDGEASEQRTTSWICYPVLIVLLTASLLLSDGVKIQSFGSVMNIVFIFVLYLLMVFFARRKIAVTKIVLLGFVALVVTVVSITFVFTSTRGFDRIQEFPNLDEVENVYVSVNVNAEKQMMKYENVNLATLSSKAIQNKESIQNVYEMQKTMVENSDKLSIEKQSDMDIYVNYTLQNGNSIIREYRFYDEKSREKVWVYIDGMIKKGYFDEYMRQQDTLSTE